MLSSAATTLASVMSGEYDTTFTIQKAASTTSMGAPTQSWDSPVTVTTVSGLLQPASNKAVEAAGITPRLGLWRAFTAVTTVTPGTHRLTTGGKTYDVVDARAYDSHLELLLEEVST